MRVGGSHPFLGRGSSSFDIGMLLGLGLMRDGRYRFHVAVGPSYLSLRGVDAPGSGDRIGRSTYWSSSYFRRFVEA